MPFPSDETTPPVMKIYFVIWKQEGVEGGRPNARTNYQNRVLGSIRGASWVAEPDPTYTIRHPTAFTKPGVPRIFRLRLVSQTDAPLRPGGRTTTAEAFQ